MRKLLMCLVLASSAATAGESVMMVGQQPYQVGDLAKPADAAMLMFDRPCELPLVNAQDMRAAIIHYAKSTKACWGRSITGDILIVDPVGGGQNLGPERFMTIGEIQADSSIRITSVPSGPKRRYQP
ncbi:hypothetical protein [Pseudomonas tohonis]|uniref:hypothetical protein n=1 Tax=Pseudomonas tohonis TaxID=2725477 RepID=UPI001F44BE98|nr:hypothetical protein [Pseudomonas tohonis]